jgi:hypothetical protein
MAEEFAERMRNSRRDWQTVRLGDRPRVWLSTFCGLAAQTFSKHSHG